MIRNPGLRPEAFIGGIDATIARRDARVTAEDVQAAFEGGDGSYYLGGGYWRGLPVWDESTGALEGIRLVNPDRTREECAAVERGIAILLHLEFVN